MAPRPRIFIAPEKPARSPDMETLQELLAGLAMTAFCLAVLVWMMVLA